MKAKQRVDKSVEKPTKVWILNSYGDVRRTSIFSCKEQRKSGYSQAVNPAYHTSSFVYLKDE